MVREGYGRVEAEQDFAVVVHECQSVAGVGMLHGSPVGLLGQYP